MSFIQNISPPHLPRKICLEFSGIAIELNNIYITTAITTAFNWIYTV